jgi:hypothetical protein
MADEPTTPGSPSTDGEDVLAVAPRALSDAPLGGEVDEWGEQDDAVAFARIAGFPTEAEASEVARFLVENGVGATVSADNRVQETDPDGLWGVHVLFEDRRRAAEMLGLVAVDEPVVHSPEETIKVEKGPIPWKVVLPIFALALIVVPLAAGFLTYFVMSR